MKMIIIDLTNREIASLILVFAFVIFVLILSRGKDSEVAKSLLDVVCSFFNRKIIDPFLAYFIYASAILYFAERLGFWHTGFLKDTRVIIFGSLGFLVSKVNTTKSGADFWKDVLRSAVGLVVIFQFYINTVSFTVISEIILQALLVFFAIIYTFAERQKEAISIKILCVVVIAIIAIIAIIHTTREVISNPYILVESLPVLILSIWLPLIIAPFSYIFLLLCGYETILLRKKANTGKPFLLRIKVAMFFSLGLNLFYVSNFHGQYQAEIFESTSFRKVVPMFLGFKNDINAKRLLEKTRLMDLKKYAGNSGVDENGCRLDRREFFDTKKVLDRIYYSEMGRNRNVTGEYYDAVLDIVQYPKTLEDKNNHHGFHLVISDDKKCYYAWRKTIGGWCFGIGGTEILDEKWVFSSDTSPVSFPGGEDTRWMEIEVRCDGLPMGFR